MFRRFLRAIQKLSAGRYQMNDGAWILEPVYDDAFSCLNLSEFVESVISN